MKVNLTINSSDGTGEVSKACFVAMMDLKPGGLELKYIEILSDDKKEKSSSAMMLNSTSMRMTRKGNLESDFFYESKMTHNTTYKTSFGIIPITIETNNYEFYMEPGPGKYVYDKDLFMGDFKVNAYVDYSLIINCEEPMPMKVAIEITNIK